MSETLLINGMVMTVDEKNTLIDGGAVAVRDGRIVEVGATGELLPRYPGAERLDARGMVVMPGLVNTHTHLSMTMTRGIADDIEAVRWLPVIWAVEKNLSPDVVYAGAMLGIAEMVLNGTTTFNDHYFHMEQVARAVQETGVRAELAEGIIENRNRKKGQADLARGRAFAMEWQGKAEGRIRTRMGPHALYTCSSELVEEAARTARELGVGMHMHVAESALEMKMVGKKARGATSVQHLDALGILDEHFCMAHGLTINTKDMQILAERKVGVAHCPQAYGKLGAYPYPEVDKWLRAGMRVGLGTDGAASNNDLDLFDEMRFASMMRKLFARDGTLLSARQVLRMATLGGAQALDLGDQIGSLEPGKKADIILVDFRKPHLTPLHNIPGHLVYCANGADVDTVMVDGRILLRNRKFQTLDLDDVLVRAQNTFEQYLQKGGWKRTLEEPKAGLAAALKLKVTQESMRMIQILVGEREPEEGETL